MTSQTRSSTTQSKAAGKAPELAPAPVMNLLDFDDNEGLAGSSAPAHAVTEKALPALAPLGTNENGMSLIYFLISTQSHVHVIAGGEDDFADFQAAPSSPHAITTTTKPLAAAPVAAAAKPNLMDLLASTAPATSKPVQSAQPQSFSVFNTTLVPSSQVRPSSTPAIAPASAAMPVMNPMGARSTVTSPVSTASPSLATTSTKKQGGAGAGGFDDLWTMSLGSAAASKPGSGAGGSKSIRDLEKEKAQAGIWGAQNQSRRPATAGDGFGSFIKSAGPSSGGGGGGSGAPAGADDLLL